MLIRRAATAASSALEYPAGSVAAGRRSRDLRESSRSGVMIASLCAGTFLGASWRGPALAGDGSTFDAGQLPPGQVAHSRTRVPAATGAAAVTRHPLGPQAGEQLIVLGQRTPAKIARAVQMEAPNLVLVQPYQEIRKLPDISAAEALRRMPGISLEADEGEGR